MEREIKDYISFINEKKNNDDEEKVGKIFIVLGAPGSGKGTLSKIFVEKKGYLHISTGDLIRNSDDKDLKKLIKNGNFIPDNKMVRLLRKKMKESDLSKGVILDGFPRTIKQAKMLESMLGKMGLGLSKAIYLKVSEEKAKERIKRRASKENRADDQKDEIIDKRFQDYKDKTVPLIDFYTKSRKALTVDATETPTDVYNKIVKKLSL